jgi:DNA-binding IclR family transcriptional regulator
MSDADMELLINGFMVRDRLDPETLSRWRAAFRAEVKRRDGMVGDHYVTAVAKAVLAEVAAQATRRFAMELVPRVREYATEAEVEALETELSDVLARTLKEIEDK